MSQTVQPPGFHDRAQALERPLCGSLLWMSSAAAASLLEHLPEWYDPTCATVGALIRDVVDIGISPEPVAVLAQATRAHPDRWPAIGVEIASLYGEAAAPSVAVWMSVQLRREEARRRLSVAGQRIAQVAETGSLEDLVAVAGRELAEGRAAWDALDGAV
jgi:hypothetical protein